MFNGIIRHQGKIASLNLRRGVLIIQSPLVRHFRPGDSIAVDGVCLTVTRRFRGAFRLDLSPETLRRTNFRWARPGYLVNLELPLRVSDRLHGHVVLGHVDGIGVVKFAGSPTRRFGREFLLSVFLPWNLASYLAEKGSITLNGVSLTIARHSGRLIQIALIPETLRRTNLRFLKAGSRVNVEVDVLARYTLGKERKRKRR